MTLVNSSSSSSNRKKTTNIIGGKFFTLLCVLLLAGGLWAISISVIGSWTEFIDAADLQGPPGSDLISSYESASDQIDMDLRGIEDDWEVRVRKSDVNWHANFTLYARRTSDGTAEGPLSGGTSYQVVTDTNQFFFNNGGGEDEDIYNIYIQLRVDGISVQIPPDTYTTTVIYTVYEF